MQKTSVFIDTSPLLDDKLSGIGHTTLSLITHLTQNEEMKKTHRVYLVVPFLKKERLLRWGIKDAEMKPVYVPARVWNYWPRLRLALPIDLFLGKGTYIFTNYKKWPLLFSKSATFIYDVNYLIYPEYVERRNLKMLQKHIKQWVEQSNRIITISESSKSEIIQHLDIPVAKIDIVYCGVDRNTFKPQLPQQVASVKSKYGITKEYLLFLSNIEPRKNIQRLVQALRQLPEYKQTYGLVLVGGMSWSSEQIWQEINAARDEGWDIIKPDSYVPDEDLPGLLSGAVGLIHPAHHEGFGISPLQAAACGTPVLVSDIPVMHEIVGEAGQYFDPQSTESIKTCLTDLFDNKEQHNKAMAQAGPIIAERFSWDQSADKMVKLINELEQ